MVLPKRTVWHCNFHGIEKVTLNLRLIFAFENTLYFLIFWRSSWAHFGNGLFMTIKILKNYYRIKASVSFFFIWSVPTIFLIKTNKFDGLIEIRTHRQSIEHKNAIKLVRVFLNWSSFKHTKTTFLVLTASKWKAPKRTSWNSNRSKCLCFVCR